MVHYFELYSGRNPGF
jgi:hypothetical protein